MLQLSGADAIARCKNHPAPAKGPVRGEDDHEELPMRLTQGLLWCRSTVPDRVGTIFEDRHRTWAEVAERVARLANGIQRLGVAAGDRVAIFAQNSDSYAEALFAIAWAGAVSVPLNTRWAEAELVSALEECTPELAFVDSRFATTGASFAAAGVAVVWIGEGTDQARSMEYVIEVSTAISDECRAGDALASIFFTGGTTGRNKGVMLSHLNLMSNVMMQQVGAPYKQDTRFLYTPPLYHLIAASSLFVITMIGGTNIFLPGFDPIATLDAIRKYRVTALALVPTMIGMLCDASATVPADVSTVTRISYGASAISSDLLRRALAAFPEAEFAQGYGQTELAPALTFLSHADHIAGRLRSAGRPLPLAELRVVDESLRPLPEGEIGEVVARGPNMMLGYWGHPELTRSTIVEGWLKTGDAGYLDEEGYLYLVDRVKDMIVSGGENVYSAEVENALAQHPGVAQCAVIGVPDDRWGERVHAVVCIRLGATVTEIELAAHCRTLIAGYKCPRSFDFRDRPLPLSGVGKILKTELRQPYWTEKSMNIA